MTDRSLQTSFLSGVISPLASARIETDSYNSGMLVGENIVPIHLGPVRRRPGLLYKQRLPNILTRAIASSATTANGGTPANANDDTQSTALVNTVGISTTNPYVVVHYDLGSAKTITYADVIGISMSAGSASLFYVQYSTDDTNWTTFDAPLILVNQVSRDYRLAGAATARYWRIAKIGANDLGTAVATVKDFNLWTESTTPSLVRLISWEVSADTQYIVALTHRSASIFQNGVFAGRMPMPYGSTELADIDAAYNTDTLVLTHQDHAPRFCIIENGNNFQTFEPTFDTVPLFDFSDSSSPTPTSDVQVITFAGAWVQGDTFTLELGGAKTGVITFAGDATATAQAASASNIAKAVQKMYTVRGFTGVSCARTGALTYTVTFANGSADNYPLMNATILDSDGTATIAKSANGSPRTEKIWSATRGFPRTVTFFEGRMWFGGTKSRQETLMGTAVNNILSFDVGSGLDDDAVVVTLNGESLNAIQGMCGGRSLQIFTTGGEFRFIKDVGQPILPGDAPKCQTEYGSAKVRPVAIDGSTLFVQRTRKAIRDYRFDYTQNAYDSLGVSALAPELFNGVVDMASYKGSSLDEINLVFIINGDGTVAVFNSRKEAQVQAWTRWTTAGLFKAVAVANETIYFAVQRVINGTTVTFFEQASYDAYTDAAAQTTLGAPDTLVFNFAQHLIGATVRVRADGWVLNNQVPTVNAMVLERASTFIEAGLNFNPTVTPMPLNTISPGANGGATFMRKRRIIDVRVKVRDTLGLLINDIPQADREYDVSTFNDAPMPLSTIYKCEVPSLYDETEEKIVTFTQVDPLPMTLLGLDITMADS